jgi:hypothetical protein
MPFQQIVAVLSPQEVVAQSTVEVILSSPGIHCVVTLSSVERIIGPTADDSVMPFFSVKCCVRKTPFKVVITGTAEEPEALFLGLKGFRIACTV